MKCHTIVLLSISLNEWKKKINLIYNSGSDIYMYILVA